MLQSSLTMQLGKSRKTMFKKGNDYDTMMCLINSKIQFSLGSDVPVCIVMGLESVFPKIQLYSIMSSLLSCCFLMHNTKTQF